jgi:hypothetical protein
MRLLAYGGTSLIERCQVGKWPEIPEGALGDRSSLVGSEFSYGVGLLEDQLPFVILRQRQNLQNRGGYAFTLLLDPGEQVWKTFGWNGADLAQSLLKSSLGQNLVLRPEDFTENEIRNRLSEIEPSAEFKGHEDTGRFWGLWAGAIVLEERLMVDPKDVGFERLPRIETMASCLSSLLPCFRCPYGWLVGGSKEHGEAFGAHLVFDEVGSEDRDINSLIEEGENILTAWNTVSANPSFEETTRNKSDQPVFLWKPPEGRPLKKYLKGITILGDYLGEKKSLDDEPDEGTGLEQEIERARNVQALSGSHPLNEAATRLVVGQHFRFNLRLRDKDVQRLHSQTLIEELFKRGKQPTDEESRMRLPSEIRLAVWRKLIESEKAIEGLPLLLGSAVKDLLAETVTDGVNYSQIAELADITIDRTVAAGASLQPWAGYWDDSELQYLVGDRLRKEAGRRIKEGGRDRVLDYLVFGGDEGGVLLANDGIEEPEALAVVTALLAEVQQEERLSHKARQWLDSLASSPLRPVVPITKKIELAKTLDDQWTNLAELWRLYCGQEPAPDMTSTSHTESEREFLGHELREMIKTQRVGSAVPNLQGIIDLLRGLTDEEIERLAGLIPPLTWKSSRSWLAGWETLQRRDLYQRDLVRLVLSQEDPPESFSTDQLTENNLRTVITGVLTDGAEDTDAKSRHLIRTLLSQKPRDGRLTHMVLAALKEARDDSARAEVLARRFRQRSRASELLFQQIDEPSQDELIALFAKSDEERFVTEAYQIYIRVLNSLLPLSQYDRALLRFLRHKRAIKNRIATWYHNLLEADDIDKNLDMLLEQSASPEPDSVDEEANRTSQSWLAASLQPLLPDRVHQLLFEVDEAAKPKRTDEADDDQIKANEGEKTGVIGHTAEHESEDK